jgi:hypothetical protein
MNLIQQFPNISRRERRKPVDHGPDDLDFAKEFKRDMKVLAVVSLGVFTGIAIVLYYSAKYNW